MIEDHDLARQYKAGERKAGDVLLKKHAGLVWNVARGACLTHRVTPYMDDVLQEARIGFLRGVERYDATRETKLSTWGATWARAYAMRSARLYRSIVRPPMSPRETRLRREINAAVNRLGAAGIAATTEALADATNATIDEVAAAQALYSTDASLDVPLIDRGSTRGEMLATDDPDPEANALAQDNAHRVRRAYNAFSCTLAARERRIWETRWSGEVEVTLADLGRMFNLTRERIRQIEAGLLVRFRDYLAEEGVAP
jgi:RNA polymerase sigma-32 factor